MKKRKGKVTPIRRTIDVRERIRSEVRKEFAELPDAQVTHYVPGKGKRDLNPVNREKELCARIESACVAYNSMRCSPKPNLSQPQKRRLSSIQTHATTLNELLVGFPFWQRLRDELAEVASLIPHIQDMTKEKRGPATQLELVAFCQVMVGAFREIYGDEKPWSERREWLKKWCQQLDLKLPSERALKQAIKNQETYGDIIIGPPIRVTDSRVLDLFRSSFSQK